MTGVLYKLGHGCARFRFVVLAIWIVAAVALVAAAASVGNNTSDNVSLPGTGSQTATNVLDQRFKSQANGSNPIVVATDKGKLTDSSYSKAIDSSVSRLKSTPHVKAVVNPLSSEGKNALSKDEQIAYVSVSLDVGPGDITEDQAQAVLDAADPAQKAGLQVAAGGYVGTELSHPSTHISDIIGLGAAVIILLLAFGTAVAMTMPIVTAVTALAAGLGIITLLGEITSIPSTAPTIATMIGLAVGIDYSLFVVTKHRSQLAAGMPVAESIARATATAGAAVLFAGGTVAVALLSLAVAGIPLVTTLGYTAAIAVALAILAALTLLPALFALLGHRINALKLPIKRKEAAEGDAPRGWGRIAVGIERRPWLVIVAVLAVLLTLAIPTLSLYLGSQDNGAFPTDTQTRRSYDLIDKGFGPGANGPFLITADLSQPAKPDKSQEQQLQQKEDQQNQAEQAQVQQLVAEGIPQSQAEQQVQNDPQNVQAEQQLAAQKKQVDSPASDPRLTTLQNDLAKTKGVDSVTPPLANSKGTAAVYTLVATTAPSDRDTEDLVHRLRDTTIPDATKGQGMTAYVGGTTATYVDLADKISSKLLLVILVVVLISFLVLLLGFRSLVLPTQAAIMNLVSVVAAYGVLTAVFQKGWGVQLIGLDGAIPVVSYVPLIMFAVLFGLSTDYQVFLLTQVQETFHSTKDNRKAVVHGLAFAGRVVPWAALVMISVFASFILNGNPTVKQFGVGLAVAVLIDAIVVMLFVPALITVVGKATWALPHWLGRLLPRINIEGEGYFEQRDAEAAAKAGGGSPRSG